MAYDIIGDTHGHADKLLALLNTLGYREKGRALRHPERTAIFVGDLIDRGPNQVATIDLVRRMVDAGAAQVILGNHEFNALSWATQDPDAPGEYLRSRTRTGNRLQHQAFLTEVEDTPLHSELSSWFKTLPLWLDLGDIRVVHACWNDAYMAQIKPLLGPGNTLTDDLLVMSSRKGTMEFEAIEAICKGLEVELPDGVIFHDNDGLVRRKTRLKWWLPEFNSLRDSVLPENMSSDLPDIALPSDPRLAPYQGPPVFFGHYWLTGTPRIQAKNIACVDYSAGKNGSLVAYRWNGESELRNENFVTTKNP